MSGDALVKKVDLHQFVAGMQLNLFANTVMRHRIEVLIIDKVIIDINAGCFDVRILDRRVWVTVSRPCLASTILAG
jgi:hypothetical protein